MYPINGPGDTTGLRGLIQSGEVEPSDIQGVMVTHEGDLAGNEFATIEVAGVLAEHLGISRRDVIDDIPIQALAGANGFMVPHAAVFTRTISEGTPGEKRFVVAGATTRRFNPNEVGTAAYAREIRSVVTSLMDEADVAAPEDVHLVFAKTPWPNPDRLSASNNDAQMFPAEDWWGMLRYAQGGAAIGIASALGEIVDSDISDERIVTDRATLYSTVAQCSSTEDRDRVAIMLFANTTASISPLVIGHGVLDHGMDTAGIKEILRALGFEFSCCPDPQDLARIRYAWVKPKTSEAPDLLGQRHTLVTHGVLGPFWWMVEKGPIHAAVASVLGTTVLEVATGREHQGPPGKPLVAVLADAEKKSR